MSDLLTNDQMQAPGVPTLTLAPTMSDAAAPASAPTLVATPEEKTPAALDDSMLSDEEKRMVDNFSQQINVRDSGMILQYGAGAQKKMADFSESALASVRTQDLGEVGGLISSVVVELRSFDATEE